MAFPMRKTLVLLPLLPVYFLTSSKVQLRLVDFLLAEFKGRTFDLDENRPAGGISTGKVRPRSLMALVLEKLLSDECTKGPIRLGDPILIV
jgi:hypothetical protein